MNRLFIMLGVVSAAGADCLGAQQNPLVTDAQAAYEALDYVAAIRSARQALSGALGQEDQVVAYELLGFAYGALDSTRQAVEAFQRLIFLAPDREPDVVRVSPRITSLYASALGQVLVVRRLHADSASFVAGSGALPIRFEVSRGAFVEARVVGQGMNTVFDTQTVTGSGVATWNALRQDRQPVAPGRYEILVTAREGARSEYTASPLTIDVEHGVEDTLPLLISLPGYSEQPELVTPPRDWKPLALATLYTGLGAGAALALNQSKLGTGGRTVALGVGGGVLLAGLFTSLRKADPRPSPTNVLYNQLLREFLAQRNAEIARDNSMRRRQVVLFFRPLQ